jgi:hypothetical protein
MTERAERPARPAARQPQGRKSQIAANARPPAPLCTRLAQDNRVFAYRTWFALQVAAAVATILRTILLVPCSRGARSLADDRAWPGTRAGIHANRR